MTDPYNAMKWAIKLKESLPNAEVYPCLCIGPQNGEPLCPCRMRDVRIIDGRYVQVIDHGPAPEKAEA